MSFVRDRREDRLMKRRRSCDRGDGDWVRQLQAKNTWIHQKLEAGRRVPPLDPEGVEPCRHLDLRLLVFEMNVILCCPHYVNFLGSPRKLIGCQGCRSNRIAVMLPPSTYSKGERT